MIMCFDNILMFEYSDEALEAVKSGNAIVSTGGIRRKGSRGFLELGKPAGISAADFQSLFESKEHAIETDDRLQQMENNMGSIHGEIDALMELGLLNKSIMEHTYTLTYDGFCQTLYGIEQMKNQLFSLDQYIRIRDRKTKIEAIVEKTEIFMSDLRTDAGLLQSKKYDVTNGSIAKELGHITVFLKDLYNKLNRGDEDSFIILQVLLKLLSPYVNMVRKFTALYYYDNEGEQFPSDYPEWKRFIDDVCKSRIIKEKLYYYINLKFSIPFRDKNTLFNTINTRAQLLSSGVWFDEKYIQSHSRSEYVAIGEQIRQKASAKDYYLQGKTAVLFLDT